MRSRSKRPDLGKIESFTFENGLSVYVRENKNAPVVNVQAWVKNGSINEDKDIGCGLSHYLEHMVFQGTKKYSSSQIMDEIHKNGGDINAYTSFGSTVYYTEILSGAVDTAIDVISELVIAPTFPEKNFKTEKDVILRERSMIQDSPDRLLGEKLWQTIFQHHPVRHPIIGYSEKIESVDREMMVNFYKQRYTPERIFFVISGDINASDVIEKLSKKVSKMAIGNLYNPYIPLEPSQSVARVHTSYFDDPLSRISVGFKLPKASNSDIPALNMLSSILGGDKSSRLVTKLRNKQQLALNIDAFTYTTNFEGVFAISATCTSGKRSKLKDAIFAEILNISKGVSSEEIDRVKKQTTTSLYRGLRSNSGIAQIIGGSVLTYDSPDYAYKYIDDIESVTESDLKRVAKQYLMVEKSSYVELLPLEEKLKEEQGVNESIVKSSPKLKRVSNGIKMVHFQDNSLPLVDISIILPGGGIYENSKNVGITKLLSTMLHSGTKSFSEDDLSALLDNNAINCHISGGNNSLSLRINCPTDSLKKAVTALKSILSEPLFSEEHFKREQKIKIESIKTRRLNPQRAAEDQMCKSLYGDHPYSNPAIGLEASVSNMSIDDVKDFYYNRVLIPSKCVMGIGGDIDLKSAEKLANQIVDVVPWNSSASEVDIALPIFPSKPEIHKVHVPREQSVVMMGMAGCSNVSEDRFAMDILQTALNGMDTRLFKSIRDEAGLAYYTGLYSSRGFHDGFIAFYAGTNPENSKKVIALFNKEKTKLVKNGLTKKEFATTLARLEGEIASQCLNNGEMLFSSVLSEFYGNGFLEQWEQLKIYSKITLNDVNKLIKKYFTTKGTVTVVAENIK